MSFIGASFARRVGIWALIQALPGEAALRTYLRAAYLGIAGVIVASVLTGAALAAGLAAAYRLLLTQGWNDTNAWLAIGGVGILLILGCFYLANRWFMQLASIKSEVAMFNDVGRDVLSGAFNTLVEGFLEGMTRERNAREAESSPGRYYKTGSKE